MGIISAMSVGYGDLYPSTDFEMAAALTIMVAGIMFFGYIIASVTATLANADAQRARFQEKLSGIERFMQVSNRCGFVKICILPSCSGSKMFA